MLESLPMFMKLLLESNCVRRTDCSIVQMKPGSQLSVGDSAPRFAHILLSGATSHSVCMLNGDRAFVRMSSRGDLVEIYQLMSYAPEGSCVTVSVPGEAVRIPFGGVARAFCEDQRFRRAILVSAARDCMRTQRLAACNLFHTIEERLARYLLTLSESSGATVLPLTQEYLAQELGVQRSTLVVAIGELRRKGCVSFSRGRIQLLDAGQLARASCECYHKSMGTLSSDTAAELAA